MRLRHHAIALIAIGLVAAVMLGGLQGGDTAEAAETVETFLDALADGDGPEACAKPTAAAKAELVELAGGPRDATCAEVVRAAAPFDDEEFVEALEDADATVQLDGDPAIAEVSGSWSDLDLMKAGDEWLITGGFENQLIRRGASRTSGGRRALR